MKVKIIYITHIIHIIHNDERYIVKNEYLTWNLQSNLQIYNDKNVIVFNILSVLSSMLYSCISYFRELFK